MLFFPEQPIESFSTEVPFDIDNDPFGTIAAFVKAHPRGCFSRDIPQFALEVRSWATLKNEEHRYGQVKASQQ